ncbi:MAG: anthranilate synthase component I family protein [Mariprofundaceae bacterium]
MFFSHSEKFAALLEDSKGVGKQFLVSKSGNSYLLKTLDDSESFMQQWKQSIKPTCCGFPAIAQIVYASYEAGGVFEELPDAKSIPVGGLLWRHEPEWSVYFDPEQALVYLASRISEQQLNEIEVLVVNSQALPVKEPVVVSKLKETAAIDYCSAVEQVKEYILAGDIFQANIARFWEIDFLEDDLVSLYQCLRQVNPAPFSCFLKTNEMTVISSSPERLFCLSADGLAETRPIAGTRKRSLGQDDELLRQQLLLSDKERAEHIMLVDLMRNDLGRVCVPGSVAVNECMVIEKYPTVQHIVSNVQGQLDRTYDVLDLFAAMFPGGTITGCPKVRCMEIIHELEHQARGPYTGGVGYIAHDGSADMNILIRSFWHDGEQLHWAAGAGIVADSNPEHEREETDYKAAGLLRALDELSCGANKQ